MARDTVPGLVMFWSDTLLLWTINYVMTAGWEWGCVGMIPVSRSVAESCPSGQGGVEWYVPRHLHSSEGDVWPQCGRPYVSGGAIGTTQLSNDTGGVGDNWNAYQLRNNLNSRTHRMSWGVGIHSSIHSHFSGNYVSTCLWMTILALGRSQNSS